MIEKYTALGIPCRLMVMEGQKHGWPKPLEGEYQAVVDWFNRYLLDGGRQTADGKSWKESEN